MYCHTLSHHDPLPIYYGASLVDASPETKARGNSRPNTSLARNFGFFPTPDEVADGVISEAYIQNGCRVLEPSAGTGALARRAADEGGIVTCIEVQPHLALQLEQEQRYESVFAMDFLALTPRSEEHTSELQSLMRISYAVFCLQKKKQ